MKKKLLFALFNIVLGGVFAQCSCTSPDYGSLNVSSWTVGQSANIATNIWAGERSLIQNTLAGATYRISTCGASYDTQLTIYTIACGLLGYNDDNGPSCATTRASIDIISPGGDLYSKLSRWNCATNTTNTIVSVQLLSLPSYKTDWISMNTGSSDWCAGETRNVSVTVKNSGTQTWTDGSGSTDFNIGIKWNTDIDYPVLLRANAGNLTSGSSQTYNFSITAPATAGAENLSFDVVREGCFWFANNGIGCSSTAGPGNIVYVSPAINIKPIPTAVSAGTDVTICSGNTTNLISSATAVPMITTALFEDFNGSPTWMVLNGGTSADTWVIDPGSVGYINGTPFAIVDSYDAGFEDMDETLISDTVDVSAYTTLYLEFDHYYNDYSIEIADVDVWNGTVWVNVARFTSDIGSWASPNHQNINVTAYKNSAFLVRFHYYNAYWDYYWAVDNVKLSGLLTPTISYSWTPAAPIAGLSDPNIANPIASPTTTTDYIMTATAGGCSAKDTVTVTVNGSATPPASTAVLATTNSSSTCVVNDANWHYFYNTSGQLLAGINSNGQNLGDVTIAIEVGNSGPYGAGLPPGVCGYTGVSDGEYALPRNWDISVVNQPANPVDVKFYFTDADVAALTASIAGLSYSTDYISCWGNVVSSSDLMMTVDHGSSLQTFPSLSFGPVLGADKQNIQFQLSSFSSGKLHAKGGVSTGNPLPVELISFTARAVDNEYIQLDWATATEINNDGFQIERSLDGEKFSIIAWANGAGNSNRKHEYTFSDYDVYPGIDYYYRLKQVDFDGQFEYLPIQSAQLKENKKPADCKVYPNPAFKSFNVESNSNVTSIKIFNTLGKNVLSKSFDTKNATKFNVDVSNLKTGMYFIYIYFGDKHETKIEKIIIK